MGTFYRVGDGLAEAVCTCWFFRRAVQEKIHPMQIDLHGVQIDLHWEQVFPDTGTARTGGKKKQAQRDASSLRLPYAWVVCACR